MLLVFMYGLRLAWVYGKRSMFSFTVTSVAFSIIGVLSEKPVTMLRNPMYCP